MGPLCDSGHVFQVSVRVLPADTSMCLPPGTAALWQMMLLPVRDEAKPLSGLAACHSALTASECGLVSG